MCELFGVSSREKIPLNELLREFFSHGREHPHGWGMAFFYKHSAALEKQPECSCDSLYLKQRLRTRIEETDLIAHIRLATRGITEYVNCHPFVLRDSSDRAWTLAHNGTIFESGEMNKYCKVQQGQTDSERILYYIIDCVNRRQEELQRPLNRDERCRLLDGIICRITPENKVNLIIFDGEVMYVHTNYAGSLHRYTMEDSVVFSTRPLTPSRWEQVPLNTLHAYEKGRLIFRGTDHGNEFFDSEEKMRLLFLDFSGL